MKLSTRLIMAMVGLVLFTVVATEILIYRNVVVVALPRTLERLDSHVRVVATEFEAIVRSARADVLAFRSSLPVDEIVRASSDARANRPNGGEAIEWRRRLASWFAAELTAKPWYDQFRMIGIADGGREIVRVDHSGTDGAIRAVPEVELQRKGDRDYFRKTIALAAGEVYMSPIDLNQERGGIEPSRVPTIRAATPLFAPDDRPSGIVIIDLDLRPAFARIRSAARQGRQVYLVNETGDYLVHPDPNREFGFERGSPARVQDDYPGLAELLHNDDAVPRLIENRSGESFGVAWQTLRLGGAPRVAAIETLPYPILMGGATTIGSSSMLVALAAVLVAFVLAVIIARSMTKPLVQMTRAVERFARDEPMAIPSDASGEIGVLGKAFARLSAEMREKTEGLLASERIARSIIDTTLDAIIQVNESGEITQWNPHAESMFGWSRQEAMGRPVTALYLPKGYRPRYLDMNEQLRQADIVTGERFEIDALRKDGQKIKVEISMTGVRRRGGNLYNLFVRDITAKLAAEEQLRQSQKMEALGQLTGGIAHDFNNVLTVITGTLDLLAEEVADKPPLTAITNLLDQAAGRGTELTGHLLAFARKQPLRPRETDINALIVNSQNLFRPTLGEQIEIEVMLDAKAWPALVDPSQLSTVLLNLAVNGRDAMPGGGKLTFETANVRLDERYAQTHGDVAPGDYVMVAVSDTGTGIPKAIRDRIFDPFFSTKEVGKGTGLGLSMVYGFVKQSGGHINVYSEEGHGTTIKVYLPRASGEPEEAAEPAVAPMIEGGSETILVVEDDALVRTSVTAQIQSLGYQTIAAANAGEALALIERGAAFDLLFTDVIMPGGMNGRQLAEEAMKRRPGSKVLFMSGYTENAIIHHGRLDPGVLLLAKPFHKSELARMIRRALSAAETVERPRDPTGPNVEAS